MIIVTDRETHKSRGFGYVVFTNEEDAKEAMQSMAGERGKVCMHLFSCCLTDEMVEIFPGNLQTPC